MSLVSEAYHYPLQLCAFVTTATYVATLLTGNVSQVDRLWTFLPTIYTAYFALLPLWPVSHQPFFLCPYVPDHLRFAAQSFSPRALMMLSLVVVWMCRLSYNTYRRGLFRLSDEDYRWAVLRTQIPPWLFQIFNLTFIAIIQNVLLLALSYPTFIAVTVQPHNSLALSDIGLAVLELVILALEFTADNQQFSYQTFKQSLLGKGEAYDEKKQWPGARLNWTAEDANRGFVTKGLWAFSRHPNFACEQSFWWVIAFTPLLSPYTPTLPHYTFSEVVDYFSTADMALIWSHAPAFLAQFSPLLPPFALSFLFYSSTLYTEAISASKYPTAYAAYRERVGMFSVFATLEKGLLAKLLGKTETEKLIWGSDKGKEKEN